MSLILNQTDHWQLPDGAELYSGDAIELLLSGNWVPGRIEYRPGKHYLLILEDGEEQAFSTDLIIRLRTRNLGR